MCKKLRTTGVPEKNYQIEMQILSQYDCSLATQKRMIPETIKTNEYPNEGDVNNERSLENP